MNNSNCRNCLVCKNGEERKISLDSPAECFCDLRLRMKVMFRGEPVRVQGRIEKVVKESGNFIVHLFPMTVNVTGTNQPSGFLADNKIPLPPRKYLQVVEGPSLRLRFGGAARVIVA